MAGRKLDSRQSENRAALSAIGSAAGATLDVILSDINTLFANATYLPTPSVLMTRDANANTQANNFIANETTTVTSGGTTTLTVASTYFQQFTGTTTQSVVLPNATTLVDGTAFSITNRSTGVVTVHANGGGTLQALATDSQVIFTLVNNSTSAGSWDIAYSIANALSNPMTGPNQMITSTTGGTPVAVSAGVQYQYLGVNGSGTPYFTSFLTPQVTFYEGPYTGNYIVPAGAKYLNVKMVGAGGGGGGGSSGVSGGSPANATFIPQDGDGSTNLTASSGGGGSANGGGGGQGGIYAIGGDYGMSGQWGSWSVTSTGQSAQGGAGGNSQLGRGGYLTNPNGVGQNAVFLGWGGGGSGGGAASVGAYNGGGGGGGGAYVEKTFQVGYAGATDTYSITLPGGGPGGGGGGGSGQTAGDGGNAAIIITAYFQ